MIWIRSLAGQASIVNVPSGVAYFNCSVTLAAGAGGD